jgi:hypothetical protein
MNPSAFSAHSAVSQDGSVLQWGRTARETSGPAQTSLTQQVLIRSSGDMPRQVTGLAFKANG